MNEMTRYGTTTITVQNQHTDSTALQTSPMIQEELEIFQIFQSILIRYCAEKDPLSKNLQLAGRSFMLYAAEKAADLMDLCKNTNDKEMQKREISKVVKETIAKIEELKIVLRNPFGLSTFVEPWLVENSVTWDKTTLEEYRLLVATFSGKEVNAVSHKFAQEVLDWIDKWPKQLKHSALILPELSPQVQQALVIPQEVQNYIRYTNFDKIITLTQENINKKTKIKALTQANLELAEMVEVLTEMNDEGLQHFEEMLDQQAQSHLLQIAECDRMLASLRAQQVTTTEVCQETCNVTQEMLLKTKAELVDAFNQIGRLRAELSSAWSKIHVCYNEINDLRNKDDGCSIQ